jgi:hypothetical protein
MKAPSLLPLPLSLSLLLLLVLTSCGKGDGDRESTVGGVPLASEPPSMGQLKAKQESFRLLGERGDRLRSLWQNRREGSRWDILVLGLIEDKRSAFELAQDIDDFCPEYAAATSFQKETCWLRIVSAMARYESEFKPEATYREHTGSISVGLLMMNPDHCSEANSIALLQKADKNIKCALDRMALLVARDRYLSGPSTSRGAAAYWSVLRPPYQFRNLQLGRKHQVREFTKSYRGYPELAALAREI